MFAGGRPRGCQDNDSKRRGVGERHEPLALPAIGQTTIGRAAAMAQPQTGAARDFATAGLVWVGIGIVRSLFQRRTPVK